MSVSFSQLFCELKIALNKNKVFIFFPKNLSNYISFYELFGLRILYFISIDLYHCHVTNYHNLNGLKQYTFISL